jgi:hypothetical protein
MRLLAQKKLALAYTDYNWRLNDQNESSAKGAQP